MKTYWVEIREESAGTGSMTMSTTSFESDHPSSAFGSSLLNSSSHARSTQSFDSENPSNKRMIKWNVELLSQLLRQVMARAASKPGHKKRNNSAHFADSDRRLAQNGNLLDEVKDVLALPKFDSKTSKNHVDPESITLPLEVTKQLTSYVTQVAQLYKQNPFHNFGTSFELTCSLGIICAITDLPPSCCLCRACFSRDTERYEVAEPHHTSNRKRRRQTFAW